MELIARRHRLEAAGATVDYGRRAAGEGDPAETHRCAVVLGDGRNFEVLAARERDARHNAYAMAETALGLS